MKIVSIVGARPQFIKAAALSRKLREKHQEILVHTGQHYDYEMSGIFFDGLELPQPDVNLGIGSGTHGFQTGAMLGAIEERLLAERPEYVLIYGDTNSTLAGALAAAKLSIPIAHVEAGLRSFNRRMPEEINRVIADQISTLLLCPSDTAIANLQKEGITQNVHLVGDVMLDVLYWAKQRTQSSPSPILKDMDLRKGSYLVLTAHRSENIDDPGRFASILRALNSIEQLVIFPVHPRSRKVLAAMGFQPKPHLKLIDPLGYVDMVGLVSSARLVLTDSGGLQKEAYWLAVPCLTMRNETEWVETVAAGWNLLVGTESETIVNAVKTFSPPTPRPALYGDGAAAEKCVNLLRTSGDVSVGPAKGIEYAASN